MKSALHLHPEPSPQGRDRRHLGVAIAVAVGITAAALTWWLGATNGQPQAHAPGRNLGPEGATALSAAAGTRVAGGDATEAHRRISGPAADNTADPLLTEGLRDRIEAMLMEAGDVSDPQALKKKLAQRVAQHFPPDLVTRALALIERYVDYRVALGGLHAPQDLNDPGALRSALDARQKVRAQFFDEAEYDALFAREAALDRYTLARLEIARNTEVSAEQRTQALQEADALLSPERLAERSAATAHMAAAEQTAAFNATNTDERTRYTQRSAQYGEPAAQAMAQLDREEQNWQQRLTQYSQARTQQGDGAALQQLRQQLFSVDEQLRIDAALALRQLKPSAPGS